MTPLEKSKSDSVPVPQLRALTLNVSLLSSSLTAKTYVDGIPSSGVAGPTSCTTGGVLAT